MYPLMLMNVIEHSDSIHTDDILVLIKLWTCTPMHAILALIDYTVIIKSTINIIQQDSNLLPS